jgi:hypothetical protein
MSQDIEPQKCKAIQKPETREQKRYRERINKEASEIIKRLQDKFSDFFITCENPEGEEVVNKMAEINAQWRTHCRRRNLVATAYPLLDDFMHVQVQEYYNNKNRIIEAQIEKTVS